LGAYAHSVAVLPSGCAFVVPRQSHRTGRNRQGETGPPHRLGQHRVATTIQETPQWLLSSVFRRSDSAIKCWLRFASMRSIEFNAQRFPRVPSVQSPIRLLLIGKQDPGFVRKTLKFCDDLTFYEYGPNTCRRNWPQNRFLLLYILRKLPRDLSFWRQAQFSSLRLPLATAMLGLDTHARPPAADEHGAPERSGLCSCV
jgi:hypothetical protein